MRRLVLVLFTLGLLMGLTGCVNKIEVEFFAKGSSLGTISGKSPLDVSNMAPVIESESYRFVGWEDEQGNLVDISKPLQESKKLYAKLIEIYSVYWMNESQILQKQSYEKGSVLQIPEMDIPQSSQVHYVFDQWLVDGQPLTENYLVNQDLQIQASYRYTMERIDIEVNPLVFENVGDQYWKRSGIIDNMYGIESLKITSSDESVAYYHDTHIFPVGKGECTFKIESQSGLIRYLTVIVK